MLLNFHDLHHPIINDKLITTHKIFIKPRLKKYQPWHTHMKLIINKKMTHDCQPKTKTNKNTTQHKND